MDEDFEMSSKPLNSVICYGCLSSDRKLDFLKDYEIYQKLCSFGSKMQSNILLCWECLAFLRKAKIFVERVQKAQKVLNYECYTNILQRRPEESLSNLGICNVSQIDISHYTNDTKDEEELKIKTEPCDTEYKVETINTDALYEEDIKEDLDYTADVNYTSDNYTNENYENDNYTSDNQVVQPVIKKKKKIRKLKNAKEKGKTKRSTRYELISNDVETKIRKVKILDQREVELLIEKEKKYIVKNDVKLSDMCMLCHFNVKKPLIDKHIKKHHSNPSDAKYVCDICSWHTNNMSSLKYHVVAHFYKRICTVCNYECYSNQFAKWHITGHQTATKCLECHGTFRNVREFYKHYRTLHEQSICDYCNESYNTKWLLEKHIKKYHMKNGFKCEVCNRKFASAKYLDHHFRYHHKINKECSFCVPCNRQFDTFLKYKMHLTNSNIHAGERKSGERNKKLPCPECGKEFAGTYSLNLHLTVHTGVSQFQCDQCGKYFCRSSGLKTHIKSIHEKIRLPKDKICTICGRGFSTNRILTHHIRTHTGEKPYKCEYCDAAFAQRCAMRTHVKAIHLKLKRK